MFFLRTFLISSLFILNFHPFFAQENTVGLLSYEPALIAEGYTLIFPRKQPNVYLLNNCGEVVHTWMDDAQFVPNNQVELLPDGRLLKCKKMAVLPGGALIGSGGGGCFVEVRSWENDLLWSYELNTEEERLHHDVEVLPNGNILMIAWERVPFAEAEAQGRLPENMTQGDVFPDVIFELNPETNERVWEWHAWDHIVQDVDPNKPNYGVISEHPELIDVNYVVNGGLLDWLHINAVDYDPDLDQIMLCVPYFDEMWIIDHSTTTEEAAGHSGGNAGKGGDLLCRIGNPFAYKKGTEEERRLGFPHDTHRARDFLSPDHPDYNKVVIFNNEGNTDYSSVEIFDLPWDAESKTYPTNADGVFLPTEFPLTVTHPTPTDFFSRGLSGAQILENGNLLSISGRQGYIIELSPDQEIVWEYIVPFDNGNPAEQFENLDLSDNLTFRANKYPPDYSAFTGRDLSTKGFIELNPQEDYCQRLVSTETPTLDEFSIFPNPFTDFFTLTFTHKESIDLDVYDMFGRPVLRVKGLQSGERVDLTDLPAGVYTAEINKNKNGQLLIKR